MKHMHTILVTLALMINLSLLTPAVAENDIQWLSNYDEASKLAQSKNLPIFLFFTGSDWCKWCTRLEREVLHTSDFAARAGDKFVFVSLDFPMHHQLEPRIASQNQQLKAKYGVSGFPSIIVVDPKGNKIGVTGYRQGGPNRFADEVLAMVSSYQRHRTTLNDLGANQPMSEEELKELYLKARELGETKEAAAILEKGLKNDKDNFFLLEKYRSTIEAGDMHAKDAIRLRDKLLAVPQENSVKANHDVAAVEFQVLQQRMKKDRLSAVAVVTPLTHYLEKFGSQDPDSWRINMAIAQVYLESNQPQDALKYASEALQSAPTQVKPQIDNAITYIRTQLKD